MTPEQAAALRKPFPPSAIGKLPKGGAMLDYVGHAVTTDRLLSIDTDWTWEPLAVDPLGVPVLDPAGNLWIRLTVCGVTRIGVGDGKSAKEKIGDAIRNAAMRFGVALDLWSKEELEQSAGPAAHPPTAQPDQQTEPAPPAVRTMSRTAAPPKDASREQITKMQAQFSDLGMKDRETRLARVVEIIKRPIGSSNELSMAEASKVIEALDADLAAQVGA